MTTADSKRAALRTNLAGDKLIVAPGVFDMISARIADRLGFTALYMTGYGVTASHLGLPDAGLATATEMLERVARIAGGTATPLIADADTGYGGPLNVQRTVRAYEAAGAAGLQIEDQEFPKKCGHTRGRRVIPIEDMVTKIRVAVDTRRDPDFVIVARTDARTSYGLDEALRRGAAFAEAGADVLFVESPESEAEIETIARQFDLPLIINMVPGGRTPIVSPPRLEELGYRLAIYPATGFLAAAAALESVYTHLRDGGDTAKLPVPLYSFEAFTRMMGFEAVWEFERQYGLADEE
jgi:2-methylisocitrate lyase-like PEP mutase family enzyme